MVKRDGSGALTERLAFLQQVEGDDGHGGVVVGWQEQFQEPARLMPLRGGETVMAGRLQGTQPFVCTVRSSTRTRAVTPAWRAVNARTGTAYNIKAINNPDERNAYLDILMVTGEAG
jgi:head-tail adaptor